MVVWKRASNPFAFGRWQQFEGTRVQQQENKKLLMELGAEGGSLKLYCNANPCSPKYWVVTDESYDLPEDGGHSSIHEEHGIKDNWLDALENSCAGGYWFNLHPVFIDATIQSDVLKVVIHATDIRSADLWASLSSEQKEMDSHDGIALARRALLMVEELHRMGYQQLRIAPRMVAGVWNCIFVPNVYTSSHHGAMLHDSEDFLLHDKSAASFSSGHKDKHFGWSNAGALTPLKWAHRFLREFPILANLGKGSDWAYAGWYQEMIRLTASANLPVASSDALFEDKREGLMPTWGERSDVWIPLPPISVNFV